MRYLLNKILRVESRHKKRIPICILVDEPGCQKAYLDKSLDISETGMFLKTHDLKQKGANLNVQFALPGRPPITVGARVARVSVGKDGLFSREPEGMGLEFIQIDGRSSQILRDFVNP